MKVQDEKFNHAEEALEPQMKEALEAFRLSVEAWSDAAYSRMRQPLAAAPRRRVWRLAAGWALGCALVAGTASTALFEHHQKALRMAAEQRQAEQARQLAAARAAAQARDEDDLLARVDSDISRQVPSAMEPLAQLMTGDDSK